jgi:hypothetical protein
MTAPHPKYINDDDISDLIDGLEVEDPHRVYSHYKTCLACQSYMAKQREIETSLHTLASRAICPASETLVAYTLEQLNQPNYVSERLNTADQAEIERHLTVCQANCLQNIRDLTEFFNADMALEEEQKQGKRLRKARWSQPMLSLAGSNDSTLTPPRTLLASIGTVTISLKFEQNTEQNYDISGEIGSKDEHETLAGWLAVALIDSANVASATVDQFDHFELKNVFRGRLIITLQSSEESIILPAVSLP